MGKRVHIIGCDGTWQTDTQENKTNVALLLEAVSAKDADGNIQIKKHFDGVATNTNGLSKIFNGATGHDLDLKVQEAYLHVVQAYDPGDDIFLIGFSRGAYTVRSLAGLIYKCGILDRAGPKGNNLPDMVKESYAFYRSKSKPSDPESEAFRSRYAIPDRPRINLLCFDTVGALGVPRTPLNLLSRLVNKVHEFHDTTLNKHVSLALHAASVDETRRTFSLTPMQKSEGSDTEVHTRFFAGHHSSVGGGTKDGDDKPLSDIAAMWGIDMLEKHSSLRFDRDKVDAFFNPDPLACRGSDFLHKGFWQFAVKSMRTIPDVESLHPAVIERYKSDRAYRPKALSSLKIV